LVSVLVFSFFTCTGGLSGRQVGWRGFGAETASHNFFTTRLPIQHLHYGSAAREDQRLRRKRTTRRILAFRVAGLNCIPPSSRKTNPSHGLWVLGLCGLRDRRSFFLCLVFSYALLLGLLHRLHPSVPLEHTAQDPIGG
jgi:hypothetical protein